MSVGGPIGEADGPGLAHAQVLEGRAGDEAEGAVVVVDHRALGRGRGDGVGQAGNVVIGVDVIALESPADGGTVFAGGAGAVLFAVWISNANTSSDYRYYTVVFREAVTGLSRGSAVQYRGIPIGDITDLRLDPEDPAQVLAGIRITGTAPVWNRIRSASRSAAPRRP